MPKKHCTVKPNHRQRLPTCRRQDLEQVFSLQFERTVSRDNTVSFQNLSLQIQPVRWRGTLAGCTVTVHQHLEGTLSLRYGRHIVGRYNAQGWPLLEPTPPRKKAVEKPLRGKPKAGFPLRLEIPLVINTNRTDHVLPKPDILIC